MQTPSRLRRFACFVLAWFALSMGTAIASPFVHPQSVQLVCSASGDVKVVIGGGGDDGAQSAGGHTPDCPLCVHSGGAAPPPCAHALPLVQPLAHALEPLAAAHIAARTAAPLPARGPPQYA